MVLGEPNGLIEGHCIIRILLGEAIETVATRLRDPFTNVCDIRGGI